MVILGTAVNWLLGKGLVPALIFAVFVMVGHFLSTKKQEAFKAGEAKCENAWELAIAQQRAAVSEANASAAQAQINLTDLLLETEKRNAARIASELESFKVAAAASGDLNCLSERVRNLARGTEGEGRASENSVPAGNTKRAPASRPSR